MHPKIKRMLNTMAAKAKDKRRSKKKKEPWFIYILKCADESFYTGVTNDLERRLKVHNAGRASKYTRARRPVAMIYQEPCRGRTEALIRECEIKSWSRLQKEKLVGITGTRT